MKSCSVCASTEAHGQWYSGPTCKRCYKKSYDASPKGKAAAQAWARAHRPQQRELERSRYTSEKRREKYLRHREQHSAAHRRYYEKNKHLYRESWQRYMARRTQACPPWLTREQRNQMRDVYRRCPPGFHVDHVVPLNGENVCGLHVPWNLQHLPAAENIRKGNKLA
jgi:hypothetical protein